MSEGKDGERRKGGRLPAGTDPEKRRQIIDGARRVFTSLGFDAASMSDIAREADVSKATLYVYFTSKEQLFADICAERRDRNVSELIDMLDRTRPIDEVLFRLGTENLGRLMVLKVFPAHRIVIGVAERMPEIGRELYRTGASRLMQELARYLADHVARGHLMMDDTELAAAQFLELSQASVFRKNIYAAAEGDITEAEIARIVSSAVSVFLAAYARKELALRA